MFLDEEETIETNSKNVTNMANKGEGGAL